MASPVEDSLNLRQICHELGKVQHKANKIGRELGIPPQKIKEFEQDDDALALIINWWLDGKVSTVPINWKSLVTALESTKVKEDVLAEKLHAKYCTSPQESKDSAESDDDCTLDCSSPQKSGELQDSTDDDDNALDPELEFNLRQQLNMNLRQIQTQYAAYVDCILTLLQRKRISPRQLAAFLLNSCAVSDDPRRKGPITDVKADLERADNIPDMIFLLSAKYSSFLDSSIFDRILQRYGKDEHNEDLNYPLYLKKFLEAHKISEFIKVYPNMMNPKLEKLVSNSKIISIKFNISSIQSLSTLKEVTHTIANILGVPEYTIRLIGVKKGCVCATYLIPTSMADFIFTRETVFTEEQRDKFID